MKAKRRKYASGGPVAAPKPAPKPPPKPLPTFDKKNQHVLRKGGKVPKKRKYAEGGEVSNFGKAFRAAREAQKKGGPDTFTWNNKKYTTEWKEEAAARKAANAGRATPAAPTPATVKAAPAPAPKAATPAPKAATPAPKAATPAPKAATPAPKAATPAPKAATPAPAPKAATPAPASAPAKKSGLNFASPEDRASSRAKELADTDAKARARGAAIKNFFTPKFDTTTQKPSAGTGMKRGGSVKKRKKYV